MNAPGRHLSRNHFQLFRFELPIVGSAAGQGMNRAGDPGAKEGETCGPGRHRRTRLAQHAQEALACSRFSDRGGTGVVRNTLQHIIDKVTDVQTRESAAQHIIRLKPLAGTKYVSSK